MSDFQNILDAPSQTVLEQRLCPWTSRLLNKWKTVGLTEEDGHQLLLVWGGQVVTTSKMRQSERKHRFTMRGNVKGLQWAALVFEKDTKTIKRWCEKGFFPGAFKTNGGHWRIPANVVKTVSLTHPNGFGRRQKRLFGTRVWKEFKRYALEIFGKHTRRALEFEAALQDVPQKKFLQTPLSPSSKAIDLLAVAVKRNSVDFVSLCNLARRLQLEICHANLLRQTPDINMGRKASKPPCCLNYKLLADALDIVPSTLYRRYTRKGVKEAIRLASANLRPEEDAWKKQKLVSKTIGEEINDDSEAIAEEFQKIVVSGEDAKSPFIHVHEPQNQK